MNGLLLINKEKDMTSRDVVNIVGKIFNTKKVGHTGTLDPNATGVLVLCLGNALKIVDLITAYDKIYETEVILGLSTDTLDITGKVLEEKKVPNINLADVKITLEKFIGEINQEVPLYSAVKVDGKKLYEYARSNIPVTLPIKKVKIKSIKLLSDLIYEGDLVKFYIRTEVSKGTYIRSLVRDIADELGTVGCMGDLVRIKQGEHLLKNCYTLEDLLKGEYKIIPMKDALKNFPMVTVNSEVSKKIENGMILDRFFSEPIAVILNESDEVLGIYETYLKDNTKVKPMIIFNR